VKIPRDFSGLTQKILNSLKGNRFKSVEEMSNELQIHRTWLAGYLAALETQGIIESKKIGRMRVYFQKESEG
jgi:predicted transcriptional regulator